MMMIERAEAVSSHMGSLGLPPHGELYVPGWYMEVTGLYSVFTINTRSILAVAGKATYTYTYIHIYVHVHIHIKFYTYKISTESTVFKQVYYLLMLDF